MTSLQKSGPEQWVSIPATQTISTSSIKLQLSERRLILRFFDLLLLMFALILSLAWRGSIVPTSLDELWLVKKWFFALAGVWLLVAMAFDLYDLARAASTFDSVKAIISANLVIGLFYSFIPQWTPPLEQRSPIFMFILLAIILPAGWRVFYAKVFVQPAFLRRVLVIGAGNSGQYLVKTLSASGNSRDANPFRGTGQLLVGFIDDNPALAHQAIEGLPVLGNSQRLIELVRTLQIDELIVAITHAHQINPQLFESLLTCSELGVSVTAMTTVYERLTRRVAIEHASRNIETVTGRDDDDWWFIFHFLKRIADLIEATLGLLAMLPLSIVVALANKFISPGPLFFRQERIGQAGKPFMVIKFRSMVVDAEKNGARWASKGDVRITKVGAFLRATHLDELPQSWNVLRGEMSLVGPRPERPEFVCQLSRLIPFYRARHSIRPGITGWAQIHQDYGDSVEGAKEKLEYDLYYIKHASPLLDTFIALRTAAKIIGFRGR